MERSPKKSPKIHRRTAACTVALAVGFACAAFGVGAAGAGDGSYVRHYQQARLEGIALSQRSPEQVVLAMKPNLNAVSSADKTAATTTTPPTTTTAAAPATTTTDATTSTTPSATTTAATTTPTTTDPATDTSTTGTSTTPTGTTTTGTSTTRTDTTGTSTTPTDTTTTGTSTTPTDTTTTGTTDIGTTTTDGHGRAAVTASTGSTSSGTPCHGRCTTSSGTTGVLPASLPSSTSPSSSGSFSLATATVTPAAVVSSTPATAVASAPASTPSSPTAPSTPPTPPGNGAKTNKGFGSLPTLESEGNALKNAISATRSHRSGASTGAGTRTGTAASTGTGTGAATAAGTTGTGSAGTADTSAPAATATAPTSRHTATHSSPKQQSSSGSALSATIPKLVYRFVNVIPTAVWIALGAAFALALAFAGMALRSTRRARRREKEFAAISAAALTDALTGILNRRGFTEAAERELARASRYARPFVLAYVDVRGLKAVNDTEGHLMGDELIKTVAGLMKESARADDVVGRIGGDEFALLLGEQTTESAGPVVRRIGSRVAEARAEMEISVSWELTIGIASFPDDGTTLDELLSVSDRHLYEQRGIELR